MDTETAFLGNLSDFSEDERETLLMRAGITSHGDKTNTTICIHHFQLS